MTIAWFIVLFNYILNFINNTIDIHSLCSILISIFLTLCGIGAVFNSGFAYKIEELVENKPMRVAQIVFNFLIAFFYFLLSVNEIFKLYTRYSLFNVTIITINYIVITFCFVINGLDLGCNIITYISNNNRNKTNKAF